MYQYFQNLPRAANCCFLPVPGGRPRLRLLVGVVEPDVRFGADMGDSPNETGPSGPYFLGRPLFFLTGSPEGTPGEEPILMPWLKLGREGSIENVDAIEPPLTLDCDGMLVFDNGLNPGATCSPPGCDPDPEPPTPPLCM